VKATAILWQLRSNLPKHFLKQLASGKEGAVSDTPRTDAVEYAVVDDYKCAVNVVSSTLARQLERELAEAREQLDMLAKALERIRDYQGRFGEDDPQSIAADALAAVKGTPI
jgi:hypothetical protein